MECQFLRKYFEQHHFYQAVKMFENILQKFEV